MNKNKVVSFTCNKCKHSWNETYWKRKGETLYFLDLPECPKCYSGDLKREKLKD